MKHAVLISYCLFAAFGISAQGTSGFGELISLDTGWEYRWGDSSFDSAGTPAWAADGDGNWSPIEYPSNPEMRNEGRLVWYRVRLPEIEIRDPRLFIFSIDINAEAYLEGDLIYSHGKINEAGIGRFEGWPWHLISLPEDFGGKTLFFRVYSDYRDIGLWGEILLGSGFDQMRRMLSRDFPRVLVGLASLMISLIFLISWVMTRNDPAPLYLALTNLSLLLRVLSLTHSKQFLLNAPLFWEYVKAGTYFLIPIFIPLFLETIIDAKYRIVTRSIWITTIVFFAGSMVGSLAGLFAIAGTYFTFDIIALVIILLLSYLLFKAGLQGNVEAKILIINFLIMGILAIYEMLVTNNILPWTDDTTYLMVFQFTLGLSIVLIRRFLGIQGRMREYAGKLEEQSSELTRLNVSLERKVAERTYQLERANQRLQEEKISLQITSITDGLTGLYNRRYISDRYRVAIGESKRYERELSIVMFDIDHFKRVNDSYGHQVGDEVLRKLADVFRETLRESDLAGRYGGEEFLLILTETGEKEAWRVADRIRNRIEDMPWSEPDLKVTISGGISELSDEDADGLLHKADTNLYRAKRLGRNRIET